MLDFLWHSTRLLLLGTLQYMHMAMALEGDVSPGDKAKAMQAGIKEKSLALRQKFRKLTVVANLELGDKFLA